MFRAARTVHTCFRALPRSSAFQHTNGTHQRLITTAFNSGGSNGSSSGTSSAAAGISGTLMAGLMFSRQKEERGNNQVYSWGYGLFGQLGHGTEKDETAPRRIQFLQDSDVQYIVSGGNAISSAAVSRDGELLTFGCGRDSRLGFGEAIDAPNQDTPRVVEGIEGRVVRAAVGQTHMAAITEDGKLWTFGGRRMCRVGAVGRKDAEPGVPGVVEELKDKRIVAVSCGRAHTVALTSEGEVYAFGQQYEGQCGQGTTSNVKSPTKIDFGGKKAREISAGGEHTLVLLEDGKVYVFGDDDDGQCGQGFRRRYERSPVEVKNLGSVKIDKIRAGGNTSVAISADGAVYTWGYGFDAQLGHGDRNNVGLPKLVHNLRSERIVDCAVGGGHILYITEENRVLAIGRGRNGQLGREGNIESIAAYRADPVEVRRLSALRVKQVAAGADHSMAIAEEVD
eukprot:gb/GECG01006046.1/.p1 GENE.gb/GECG01006046.1/~~gb/GECG01006046.1/.p1  ORF type:complete len:452 (+),score=62.91 gb/GECG01006046.1/:1-1356(+)